MCVNIGVEISASAKRSDEVYCARGVETAGGTAGATVDAVVGAETVALKVTGTTADLGIV